MFYWAAEFLGAFLGAILCWLAYKEHFDAEEDPALKLAVFSTGPAMRNYAWNPITEIIGTFVLIFWVLVSGGSPVGPRPAGGRLGRGRHRRLARWPHRVRHQPGP